MTACVYGYYCPVAHALGVVGEKWALLIVRDLLNEPRRFSDLLARLANITPKWLALRLRQLEEAGVVERVTGRDRREKWYRLTPAGLELRPVIEALRSWGLRHAMRPPLPGEVVHPDSAISTLAASFNERNRKLPRPVNWLFKFTTGRCFTLSYNGEAWAAAEGEAENPGVTVVISPEKWAAFLSVKRDERKRLAGTLHISGVPGEIRQFMKTFGVHGKTATSG